MATPSGLFDWQVRYLDIYLSYVYDADGAYHGPIKNRTLGLYRSMVLIVVVRSAGVYTSRVHDGHDVLHVAARRSGRTGRRCRDAAVHATEVGIERLLTVLYRRSVISIYTVSQKKTRHQTLGHNFTNYYPIL